MNNSSVYKYIKNLPISLIYSSVIIFLLICLICFGSYKYYLVNTSFKHTQKQLISATEIYERNISLLRNNLLTKKNENKDLTNSLEAEQTKTNLFGAQIESMSSVVGQLYKLSKTDRELLQKYSNVYFLNENYLPSQLSEIDTNFLYRKTKSETIHVNIKPFLEKMLNDSITANVPLLVYSAYRSFGTQASIKAGYKVTYGTTAANKFSADQGYSEHQLGSTVDLTTSVGGDNFTGFEKTKNYEWLTQNAHKYGFTLSYPKGNKYYQFEPWHWRFVGVELATKLYQEKMYFYDMDQRTINDYLVKIFD